MPTCDHQATSQPDQLTGLGAVEALETRVARHYGMRFAVAMPSATTGLLALGLALDIRGAEFITTPLTYGGSISSWLALGATPRFADIDGDSLTLAPESVGASMSTATRAILAVDLFGHPCDAAGLRREADRCGAWLVIDAAQSLGARRDGRASGSLADAVVVSFTAGKALDVGEGGAVVTDDRDLYERLVWHSQHPLRQKRELGLHRVNELAINGRIHPAAARAACRHFQGALAAVGLRREQVALMKRNLPSEIQAAFPAVLDAVQPSFYRITLRRCSEGAEAATIAALHTIGIASETSELPVSLLHRHPSLASHPGIRSSTCDAAEREWETRFCVWPKGVSFSQLA